MNHPAARHHTQGFTLIEMVISLALLAILAGLGAVVLGGGFKAYLTGQDLMESTPRAQLAMERIVRELRASCDAPTVISGGGSHTVTFLVGAPDCDTSTQHRGLRLDTVNGRIQVQETAGGNWYDLAEEALSLGGAPLFGTVNGGCEMAINFKLDNGTVSLSLNTQIYLRNYPCS